MKPELIEALTKTCTYFNHVGDMKNCIVCKKRREREKMARAALGIRQYERNSTRGD